MRSGPVSAPVRLLGDELLVRHGGPGDRAGPAVVGNPGVGADSGTGEYEPASAGENVGNHRGNGLRLYLTQTALAARSTGSARCRCRWPARPSATRANATGSPRGRRRM